MSDPVICTDGITYEREAIMEHIRLQRRPHGKSTSPCTRKTISRRPIPNRALKNAIENYKAQVIRENLQKNSTNSTKSGSQGKKYSDIISHFENRVKTDFMCRMEKLVRQRCIVEKSHRCVVENGWDKQDCTEV